MRSVWFICPDHGAVEGHPLDGWVREPGVCTWLVLCGDRPELCGLPLRRHVPSEALPPSTE